MNKQPKFQFLLLLIFFFDVTFCFGQLDKILKTGGKLLEKSPSKLTEKYFSNAPVTTNFDDAKTEVMLLGNFDPPESDFLPLELLDQNADGNYILTTGLYTAWNKSFCLKAGTHGPSRGDGHLYAPLNGPKAYLVRKLLENWQTKEPGIPQTDVQCLIWAIIARTDVEKMQPKYKLTLAKLLDKGDMAELATYSMKDKVLEAGMTKFKAEIPTEVYRVFEAERELRNMYGRVDASYQQFESYAMLAGMAPASDMVRAVSNARWSYHSNGYFIRLTPSGYSNTKVDVYIPMNVGVLEDSIGRIEALVYGLDVIEFEYDNNVVATNLVFSSGITGIKFRGPLGDSLQVNLSPVNTSFVNTDFLFAGKNVLPRSNHSEYIKKLNGDDDGMKLNLDNASKVKIFNLMNLMNTFKGPLGDSLLPGTQSYVQYILNEAHNYVIYQNLSPTQTNIGINNNHAQWEASLVAGAGPAVDPTTNNVEWFKQDKGELDLPNSVATPANRSSQRIGQSKPPKNKRWHEKLPDCPCTYKEAQNLATTNGSGWMDCGPASQTHHYGATSEVRWAGKSGEPGQQCTYDANGNLITSGIAAGSPDKVSPQACGFSDPSLASIKSAPMHYYNDVHTWNTLPCWQYLQDWPANKGGNCSSSNPVNDISHMKKLVGDMTCEEITELLDAAAKSKTINPDLRDFLQGKSNGNLNNHLITTGLNNWKSGDGKSHSTVIDKAIGNMFK